MGKDYLGSYEPDGTLENLIKILSEIKEKYGDEIKKWCVDDAVQYHFKEHEVKYIHVV